MPPRLIVSAWSWSALSTGRACSASRHHSFLIDFASWRRGNASARGLGSCWHIAHRCVPHVRAFLNGSGPAKGASCAGRCVLGDGHALSAASACDDVCGPFPQEDGGRKWGASFSQLGLGLGKMLGTDAGADLSNIGFSPHVVEEVSREGAAKGLLHAGDEIAALDGKIVVAMDDKGVRELLAEAAELDRSSISVTIIRRQVSLLTQHASLSLSVPGLRAEKLTW